MKILASPAFANEKVNPYNALLYRNLVEVDEHKSSVTEYTHKRALLQKFDLLHFHWPDGYINQRSLLKTLQRILIFGLVVVASKLKSTKIVWTVHNVAPHDAQHPHLALRFMRWFIQRCDGLLFMSDESRKIFLNTYQGCADIAYAIIPHGHYRRSYPAPVTQQLAKQQLQLPADKKVLLFCGMIKPYKNIESLIRNFIQADINDYVLVIAGNPDSAQLRAQLEAFSHPNLYQFLHFIPDNKLHVFLSAADAVILPYKAILNSGALLLALSFNKPVIAPDIGAFLTLKQELGEQWIFCYQGDLTPGTLLTALDSFTQHQRPALCPLDNYEWHKIASMTLGFYQQLLPQAANAGEQAIL